MERIEGKLDKIDSKLNTYIEKTMEKTTRLETKVGFITTGFIVLVAPVVVGLILLLIKG